MASVKFGFSATPSGTGAGDGQPDPATAPTLELTSGYPAADVVKNVPYGTTIGSPVTVWQAANHGVSATAASVDILLAIVDPARANDDTQVIGLRPVYTRTSSTSTVNGAAFEKFSRDMPPAVFPGTVEDGTGVMYLTALQAMNASTDTDTTVRAKAWM